MRLAFLITLALLAPAAAAREQDAPRPNILFAIADDASFPHMGAYGTEWVNTPAFDRVAKEGLLFTRAYTPNAKCAPSRACILTGRNSWQLEEAANHVPFFPPKFKTYCEVLPDHGYFVGKTLKGWAPGVAVDENGKKRQLTGKPFDKRRLKPPARGIASNDYAANFADFLAEAPKGKPWCFWYGSVEPHRAYEYGVGVKAGKKIEQIKKVPGFWPDNERIRNDILDYAYEIDYFDSHLAKMIRMVEERGELDNTLIVVTADNGMPFPRVKGQEYEMSNHLPLAIMWKKGIRNPGRTIDDYVSFIDFAPTFLEVAGVPEKKSGMQPIQGRSLTDIFTTEQAGRAVPERDHVLIGKERHDIGRPYDWGYPIRGIVKGGFLYIRNYEPDRWPSGNPRTGYLNCDGSPTKTEVLQARLETDRKKYWDLSFGKRPEEEFYHIESDPECLINLAGKKEFGPKLKALKDQMTAELKAQADPRMEGKGYLFDKMKYAHDSTRNFYERFMKGEKLRAGWVNKSDFEKEKLD